MKPAEEPRKELSKILITNWIPTGGLWIADYEGQRYALVNKQDWESMHETSLLNPRPEIEGVPKLSWKGIPAVEDEDLAQKILIRSL